MDCLFCKIVSGEIPCHKVYEDDFSFAFLDISPSSEGHTVVIPKKHFETFMDMGEEDAGNLFTSVRIVASKVQNGLSVDGLNIGFNNGKVAGQEVPHVHIHIIPRREDDGGGAMQTIVQSHPKTDNLEELAEKIRDAS